MYFNFDEIIKKARNPESKLPQQLVDYLSKSLPDGCQYKQVKDGTCAISATDDQPLTIGGWKIVLNEHQKKVLGDNFTNNDLFNYLVNAQTSFKVVPADGENVIIKGEHVPLEKLIISPKIQSEIKGIETFIFPIEDFKPIKVSLSYESYAKNIHVKRIANDSVDEIIFKSLPEETIHLTIRMNRKKHSSKISISLNAKDIKTVNELLSSLKLVNAFVKGTLYLNGQQIKGMPTNTKSENILTNEKNIAFWEKVEKIETYLNCQFTLPENDIDYKIACIVEELYQCLIKKVPVKDNYKVDSISNASNDSPFHETSTQKLGEPILITFREDKEFSLFEQTFVLPSLTAMFNSVIKSIQRDDSEGKNIVIFDDEANEKKRFVSTLIFKTQEEVSKYSISEHIEEFKNAKTPSEYLQLQ